MIMRVLARLLTLLALLAALAQGAPARAAAPHPATIYVCTSGCQFATVGAGLAAAAPGDTVWVRAGVYSESLTLAKNVTLRGAGADSVTLSGGSARRVLAVQAGVVATLAGVTVRDGLADIGGGIYNAGTLTVSESVVTENESSSSYTGAGVENSGNLTLVRSAVVSNRNTTGSEIETTGFLGCVHSTVSSGAGRSTSAIVNYGGSVAALGCTLAGDSFALLSSNGASAQLQSTLLTSERAIACLRAGTPTPTVLSLGNNLASTACGLNQPTDRENIADIHLGPLQVNAPGATPTRALLAGSPALDGGVCPGGVDPRDQRGVAMPQGDACDIGAYEWRAPAAADDAYATPAGAALSVPAPGVLTNDRSPEGAPVTVASVFSPAHGDVTYAADGSFRYTPQAGYTGPDSFTYRATDGLLYAAPATVTVWVGTAAPATVTVALDSQPDSAADVAFSSSLGAFTLDDVTPQDADAFGSSRTFVVPAGTYTVTEQLPPGFLDANISCSPAAGALADTANNRLTLTVGVGANVTCTFVAQRAGKIVAGAYHDRDLDRIQEASEPWLPGRQFELHGPTAAAAGTTDAEGRVTFDGLVSGSYTVCELPVLGWQSTMPGTPDPTYGLPCYTFYLHSGEAIWTLFGEFQTGQVARLSAPAQDIVVCDLPPTDDRGVPIVGERDPWMERALAHVAHVVALPLVAR